MSRLALVTGGTQGIGAAVCRALKKDGFTVVANYIRNEVEAKAFEQDTGVKIFKWDVSNYDQCISSVAQIEQEFGQNIEVLVNNAGVTHDVMLHKSEFKDWQQIIDINLTSCYNMTRAVINKMRENNFGRIISLSSVNALAGQLGQTNYAASKAGIIGFTKSLALESALKGVTANTIAPGYINTNMLSKIDPETLNNIIQKIPVKRLGTPEEVARVVVFLAADDSSFITGETISINGGLYLQ